MPNHSLTVSTVADTVGGGASTWTNASNLAGAPDGLTANSNVATSGSTRRLTLTYPAFTAPAIETVVGISFIIRGYRGEDPGQGGGQGHSVVLWKTSVGTVVGTAYPIINTTMADFGMIGNTVTMHGYTTTDLANGLVIYIFAENTSQDDAFNIRLDSVTMTVYTLSPINGRRSWWKTIGSRLAGRTRIV